MGYTRWGLTGTQVAIAIVAMGRDAFGLAFALLLESTMPRAGGEAGKLGNRYEGIWTVGRLLEVAAGRIDSLTVEPLIDGLGIEFVAEFPDGTREFHSVKRQRADGEWSARELARQNKATSRSILGDLLNKLAIDVRNRCCFVSSTDADSLRELTERAYRRASLPDFENDLQSSPKVGVSFNQLLPLCSNDRQQLHEFLRRLHIVLIDEGTLTKQVEQIIAYLVYRPDSRDFNEREVLLLLGDLVLDSLGSEIQCEMIWEYLKGFGYAKRDWATDLSVREAVGTQNQTYKRAVESDLVNGARIQRAETQAIVDAIASEKPVRKILVSAAAGMGKSCVIAQVMDSLVEKHVPTLVVRMDRHGTALRSQDIGREMGLPKSPTVVLAGMANGESSVLVVDQLDAVSQVSGRYPHLWEVFDALCQEVDKYPNMRVVIVCRVFDLDHDHRLRKFNDPKVAERIHIEPISIQNVEDSIHSAGLSLAPLSSKEKELLRTPLHLYLYLVGSRSSEAPGGFQNIGELFEQFWTLKQRVVSARLKSPADWLHVIGMLCDEMSRRMTLYVSEVALDQWPETVQAMLTEHVLVKDGTQIRFFHESFFDYAFARQFYRKNQSLRTFLLASEQHLFRRSQVRQILTFLRDKDRAAYITQLKEAVFASDIRFHLKRVMVSLLSSLSDPTVEEWEIVQSLLDLPDLGRFAEASIRNSRPWFDLLNGRGLIESWLGSTDEGQIERGYWLLNWENVLKERSEEVARLLWPHVDGGDKWANRFRQFFRFGCDYFTPEVQRLYLYLFQQGLFEDDDENKITWWDQLRKCGEDSPDFVLRVLSIWLDRKIEALRQPDVTPYGGRWLNLKGGHSSMPLLNQVRKAAPASFVSTVLPRVEQIISLSTIAQKSRVGISTVWAIHRSRHYPQTADALLAELECALADDSLHLSFSFQVTTNSRLALDSEVMADLLIHYWLSNPKLHADSCIEYLIADSRRLKLGYYTSDGNGEGAIARKAIQRCAPFTSSPVRSQLEDVVSHTSFYDSPESDQRHEWLLLEAFGDDHLSQNGRKRLKLLRSIYPSQKAEIPEREVEEGMGFVGSPIPSEELNIYSDEQLIEAMRRINYGWEDRCDSARFSGLGSAVELSRELQKLAKAQKLRFSALTLKMDDGIRAEYFDRVLNGLCGRGEPDEDNETLAATPIEVFLPVIDRIHALPEKPCGLSICDAVQRLSDRSLPESVLDIVRHYALNDQDPASDDWAWSQVKEDDGFASRAFQLGFNSVRGEAAISIQHLLFSDPSRLGKLVPVIEGMVHDHSLSVRTCVLAALLPILNHDRGKAVELFCEVCRDADPIIGCHPFEQFVQYAVASHYRRIRSILLTGLHSKSKEAVTACSKAICLADLGGGCEESRLDAEDVRTGSVEMRISAAKVYSFNLNDKSVGTECAKFLEALFEDEDEDVREEAALGFAYLKEEDLNEFVCLTKAYVDSLCFPSRFDRLIHLLDQTNFQLPKLIIELAEKFVFVMSDSNRDETRNDPANTQSVCNLVVRLYSQSFVDEIRRKCLDLIDGMEQLGLYGIDKQLAEHDR